MPYFLNERYTNMKYTKKRINGTDTHTFTTKPSEGILTLTREWSKAKVEDINHDWYESHGKTAVCSINFGYFGSGPVGGMMADSGYYNNNAWSDDKKWITLIYENEKLIIDEEWRYNELHKKYPKAVFMRQLGDPLVKDGVRYKGDGRFDHTFGRNPRTFAGQKADGTIVKFVTDGRGGNDNGYTIEELAQIALDHECVVAVNCDGGGSSTMALEGVMVNENENRSIYDALIFYADTYNLEMDVPSEVSNTVRNEDLKYIRSRHFNLHEFCNSKDGCAIKLNLELVNKSDKLRDIVGPTNINSGYRTEAYNRLVGGSTNSNHLKGDAADYDFEFEYWDVHTIKMLFSGLGYTNIGIYLNNVGDIVWIHGDISPRWPEANGWKWFRDSAVKVYNV